MRLAHLITHAAAAAVLATGAFAQVNLSAETASPGGATFLSPAHLAEIAGTRGIASIQLADGQTLTNSLQNVAEGRTDLAATPYILPFLMANGAGPYGELGSERGAELVANLRAINPFTLGVFVLYAYDAKNVSGWDGLEGLIVYNGPPRGGALNNARSIIQIVTGLQEGEGYEGLQVNWGQQDSTVMGGEPDAMVLPELFPSSGFTTAASAGNMTIWSTPADIYDGEAFQRFLNAPGIAPFTIDRAELQAIMGDEFSIVSDDETFRASATVGGTVVHRDMDEGLVYDLVSAYIETIDELMAKAPFGNSVGFDLPMQGMCGANPITYHPGAIRAWREAGYTIDECAVPS